jgi:hypothetical protein
MATSAAPMIVMPLMTPPGPVTMLVALKSVEDSTEQSRGLALSLSGMVGGKS